MQLYEWGILAACVAIAAASGHVWGKYHQGDPEKFSKRVPTAVVSFIGALVGSVGLSVVIGSWYAMFAIILEFPYIYVCFRLAAWFGRHLKEGG